MNNEKLRAALQKCVDSGLLNGHEVLCFAREALAAEHRSDDLNCDCRDCLKNAIEQLSHQVDVETLAACSICKVTIPHWHSAIYNQPYDPSGNNQKRKIIGWERHDFEHLVTKSAPRMTEDRQHNFVYRSKTVAEQICKKLNLSFK